jgi:3-isopropylmalate/(R)-2-methylmalate dehydratase small subunit
MAGWSLHAGRAVALPAASIDTDQLIPARFMSTPRDQGYGRFLLHDLRYDADGARVVDMPLNRHDGISVLVSRRNFGSGSSREAAVYALVDFGICAVLAPSFGDIFAANAANNGLLAGRIDPEDAEALIAQLAGGAAEARVDLAAGQAVIDGKAAPFALPQTDRAKLINGWDDIDLTRAEGPRIAAFRAARKDAAGWSWPRAPEPPDPPG